MDPYKYNLNFELIQMKNLRYENELMKKALKVILQEIVEIRSERSGQILMDNHENSFLLAPLNARKLRNIAIACFT